MVLRVVLFLELPRYFEVCLGGKMIAFRSNVGLSIKYQIFYDILLALGK